MALLGVIRYGDPTNTGGRILSACGTIKVDGKNVACLGDTATCHVKGHGGTVTIVEACSTAVGYGHEIAYHGCALSCGCHALSTTERMMIEVSGGGRSSAGSSDRNSSSPAVKYDQFFHVTDMNTGEVLANLPYRIILEDGTKLIGTTDNNGHTEKVAANSIKQATLEAPYYGNNSAVDTNDGSKSCFC